MDNDPLDLSALDPTRDAAHFRALTSAIARDAMQGRARRLASPRDILGELAAWARPTLAAAAVVLVVAASVLVRSRSAVPARPVASATDVLGIPQPLMDLMHSTRPPTIVQISQALASVDGAGQ
jgi:hypothetical protein